MGIDIEQKGVVCKRWLPFCFLRGSQGLVPLLMGLSQVC